MALPVRTFAAAMAAAALAAAPACAGTFSAADLTYDNALLNQFNLVNLGNYSQATSPTATGIQGRTLVGGNATFTAATTLCSSGCAGNTTTAVDSSGASYGALTVFGNLVTPGGYNPVAANAGDISVKGTSSGTIEVNAASSNNAVTNNTNGTANVNLVGSAATLAVANANAIRAPATAGTSVSSFNGTSYNYNNTSGLLTPNTTPAQAGLTAATVFPFSTAYQAAVTNLAQGIANLPGTPGVNAQALPTNTTGFFTVNNDLTAGGLKYGVVTTTLGNLSTALTNGLTGFSTGTNSATFVIVTGDGANYTLPSLNSYANANNVIFDFVNATTLKFAGNWNGSILAPLANITQQGGNINGSVVVASIAQSNALNDSNNFAGNLSGLVGMSTSVPEPASLVLLGIGALGAGLLRRRRA